MKTLWAFLGGASFVFILAWMSLLQTSFYNKEMIAFSWLAGIIIGAWCTGGIAVIFCNQIADSIVARLRYMIRPQSSKDQPPKIIPFAKPVEAEALPIEDEDDDEEENIYNDPNWWQDERKRRIHQRRNQNG